MASDRYIQVPKPISLVNLVTRQPTGEVYTFYMWLQTIVLNDARFSMDWKTNRSAMNISDAFFNKNPEEWVRLSDTDYDLLKQCVEEPNRMDIDGKTILKGYANAPLFRQIGSFISAVQNVKEEL